MKEEDEVASRENVLMKATTALLRRDAFCGKLNPDIVMMRSRTL